MELIEPVLVSIKITKAYNLLMHYYV